MDPATRRFMARPAPENLGAEKYWHDMTQKVWMLWATYFWNSGQFFVYLQETVFWEFGPTYFVLGNMPSSIGNIFWFQKLCASTNNAERYRQNILGPNFKKHLLFQFKVLDDVRDNLDSR